MINAIDCKNILTDEHLENAVDFLKSYIKLNPCCNNFPNCNHPKNQTNSYVFLSKDERIKFIKESYLYCLKKIFKTDFEVIYTRAWSFEQKENKQHNWHHHLDDFDISNINDKYISCSGIIYLNNLNYGTIFNLDDFLLEIKPKKFYWYIWPSHYTHTPAKFICDTNRYIIATATHLKLKNDK